MALIGDLLDSFPAREIQSSTKRSAPQHPSCAAGTRGTQPVPGLEAAAALWSTYQRLRTYTRVRKFRTGTRFKWAESPTGEPYLSILHYREADPSN